MKKCLLFLLIVLILTTATIAIYADENSLAECGEVYTEKTPEEVIEAAEVLVAEHLYSAIACKDIDSFKHTYSLGHPISVKAYNSDYRIYHFPVMRDGTIFATFTIYDENGEYYDQLEENLLSYQLSEMEKNGVLKNVFLISYKEGLYAVTNSSVYPLDTETVTDSDVTLEKKEVLLAAKAINKSNLRAVDITDPICDISLDKSKLSTYKGGIVLPVKSVAQTDDGNFDSPQKNWCAAAVTAAIVNYKKGKSLTAKSVTIEALGAALDKGITNKQILKVAKKHGLNYLLVGNPLSFSAVKSQINNYKPIYMQMQRTKNDGSKVYHALGLVGYNDTKYTIINLWKKNHLTIAKKNDGAQVVYTSGNKVYKWKTSISNWG